MRFLFNLYLVEQAGIIFQMHTVGSSFSLWKHLQPTQAHEKVGMGEYLRYCNCIASLPGCKSDQ